MADFELESAVTEVGILSRFRKRISRNHKGGKDEDIHSRTRYYTPIKGSDLISIEA